MQVPVITMLQLLLLSKEGLVDKSVGFSSFGDPSWRIFMTFRHLGLAHPHWAHGRSRQQLARIMKDPCLMNYVLLVVSPSRCW